MTDEKGKVHIAREKEELATAIRAKESSCLRKKKATRVFERKNRVNS